LHIAAAPYRLPFIVTAPGWHIRVCYSANGDEVVIEPERVKCLKKVEPWEPPNPKEEENVDFHCKVNRWLSESST
jgi:hypothetical protein